MDELFFQTRNTVQTLKCCIRGLEREVDDLKAIVMGQNEQIKHLKISLNYHVQLKKSKAHEVD